MLTAAFFRDPLPASSVDMLDESSITTATIFCCGRSVATLSAGCHRSNNNNAASAVCKTQTTADRTPFTLGVSLAFLQTYQPSPAAAAKIASPNSHTDQPNRT